MLRVILRVRRVADGLLAYRICLESEGLLEMAVVALLLRVVVGQLNRQRGPTATFPGGGCHGSIGSHWSDPGLLRQELLLVRAGWTWLVQKLV